MPAHSAQGNPVSEAARLAKWLLARGRFEQAVQLLETACSENPKSGLLRVELAGAYSRAGRIRSATESYFDAFEQGFHHPLILTNLGSALFREGRIREAVIAYRAALTKDRTFEPAWSNLLLSLNCLEGVEPRDLSREHARYGEVHAVAPPIETARRPGKLRIGYVSGSFFRHPVTQFLEPVLRTHDRNRFEVFCYQGNKRNDRITKRFIPMADHWRVIASASPAEAIEAIRRDDIDLLVDLDGHTGGNQLVLFAERLARIQISWLGYPNTTGLNTMDYRVTDGVADPVPDSDELHSERLLRIESPFLVFAAPRNAPRVAAAPALKNGYVTFGMFNQIHKLSDGAVSAMARILLRVSQSRLILKSMAFVDDEVSAAITERFVRYGVDEARIECAGPVRNHREHLVLHHAIDIMLDSFPYTGTTTTCEALWMGVPVVTLEGATHRERVGSSILGSVGLSRFVARNVEEYISIACELASRPLEIDGVRREMRNSMRSSRLMNVPEFTRRFESALEAAAVAR